jgi:hypothetical protein
MPEKYHFMNIVVLLATGAVTACGYTDFTLHAFFDGALYGIVVVGVPVEDQGVFSGTEYLHLQEDPLVLDIQTKDWYWNDTTQEFQETTP